MKQKPYSKRRAGVVIVYVALALVVLLGAAGLSVDVGNLYLHRDKAQRAADAAALAGAIQLMNGRPQNADAAAEQMAKNNGYDIDNGATVTPKLNPTGVNANWYQVYVAEPEPLFFMAIFGKRNSMVGASATASFVQPVNIDINGGHTYGINGIATLSVFGPYGEHYNGDNYSTMYLTNGKHNPAYEKYGRFGYDFKVSIPKDYEQKNGTNKVDVQIFDPDTYNAGNVSSPKVGSRIDEMWAWQRGSNVKTVPWVKGDDVPAYDGSKYTTTRYTLFDTKGTASTNDDTVIATKTYGKDPSTDMKWVTPDGFTFDVNDPKWASRFAASGSDTVDFRLNVKTLNGTSENGFNLRAGPPPAAKYTEQTTAGHWTYKWVYYRGYGWYQVQDKWVPESTQYCNNGTCSDKKPDDAEFDPNNGTNVTATGRIPMNFNDSGYVTIHLGKIPAGSSTVTINKFDTDVNAKSITYNDGNKTYSGTLSSNDKSYPDIYDLPSGYPGGDWYATYTAGLQDTSVWDMTYQGPSNGNPGYVRLVK